jgi:protein phosphatase
MNTTMPDENHPRADPTGHRFAWRCAAGSDVGRVRDSNEDAFCADGGTGLFIVADGMGGHAAGEVASALAVECAANGIACLQGDPSRDKARECITDAIVEANRLILSEGRAHPERTGMGTTATILFLSSAGWYVIGHVGDSRAYLVRQDEVRRLTVDHTYVQELVNQGRLTDEQARIHPRSSLLTRALGTQASVPVDMYEGELRPGDRFLVTSDGLTTMLSETRIAALLQERRAPDAVVTALVGAANDAGGTDNTTAIVVDVEEAPPA